MKLPYSTSTTARFPFRSVLAVAMLLLFGMSASYSTQGATAIDLPDPVKLNVPPNVIYGDSFGNSLAMDGDIMVVGAWRTNVGENKQQGVVYLFARDATNPLAFTLIKTLTGADSYAFQGFGTAVAIHGDTIVVGAMHDDPDDHFDAGSAYIFERHHGGTDAWGEVAKLFDVNFDDEFSEHGYLGQNVAIYGDIVVAGAPRDRGRAFVFGRNQGGPNAWGEVQFLSTANYWEKGSFGSAVAVNGERIVVGGSRSNMIPGNVFNDEGAAFVYEHDGSKWALVTKLTIADDDRDTPYGNNSKFGASIALQGDLVFVGAPNMTINDVFGIGEVYAFQRNAIDQWPLVDTFTASEAGAAAEFGRALYAVEEGIFISSDTGLDGNGMVHFFRNSAAQSGAVANVPQALHTWQHAYSFTTTEDVLGVNVGSELAGSGNIVAIGANGYDGGRGSVFTYPLDVMVAVNPEATPTDETPTPLPDAEVYLPLIAGAEDQLPAQLIGTLANNGILTGAGGFKIGAVINTLTSTVDISTAAVNGPSEPLPEGVRALGDFFQLSADRDLFVSMESPFIVSLPVPAGVDTAHLTLAYLQPLAEILDTHLVSPTGDIWGYLPGAYDAEHNIFLAKLPFLRAAGTTLALVEHPDIESPLNGASVQRAATSVVQPFRVHCINSSFPQPDDCLESNEVDAKAFLDSIYLNMVEKFDFPSKLRLLDGGINFIVTESYSATALSATYSVFLLHKSEKPCQTSSAFYSPETGFFGLCLAADEELTNAMISDLIHELFHAIQYSYPAVLRDREWGRRRSWITEGMAQAAEQSYYSTTMARSFDYGEDNLHKVDIQLSTGNSDDDYLDEYLAQDFWVYVGQSKPAGLEYLGPLLAVGGATTQGIADAMKAVDNADFADVYWGWVKNQVIENTYGLGGGPGEICTLTDAALTNGQHTSFPSHVQYYPPMSTYEYLAPLSATVIEIQIPHTDTGLIVDVGYEECEGITDGATLAACRLAVEEYFHAKIYEEGEMACSNQLLPGVPASGEGYRWLQPIREGKRYFVVLANGDLEDSHGFYIALE